MLNAPKRLFTYFISSIIFVLIVASQASAQLVIANNGKSTFSIIIPDKASPACSTSLVNAANEMRLTVEMATKARLSIVRDDAKVASPFISLGATQQAKNAGITTTGVVEEGFRIITKNGNLYIMGPDTPDGEWTKEGGVSNGTANGVYTFLEDYLNVRWLMPGNLGRDVPVKSTFTIGNIDRIEKPGLVNRRMPYLVSSYFAGTPANYKPIQQWQDVQKLGFSLNLNHRHNWIKTVPPELYKDHPDWFAMINGKRIPPRGNGYKLETTNPELIKYFAEKAIETLKSSKRPETFSLSPSDHGGWSESPESKALYDDILPNGKRGNTSLVLKFYSDVAKIVQKEYPEGKLAGYIYDTFLYPPTKFPMRLPDNFTPVLAPGSITYGYRLYSQSMRDDLAALFKEWAKVAPKDWAYYDLPNQFGVVDVGGSDDRFPGTTGIVTPPAPGILNFVFDQMTENKITAAYIYGAPAWSNTALANYILAKKMWNPALDAYEIQRDWLNRAYGPDAGKAMLRFYQFLGHIFQDYAKQAPIQWTLSATYLQDIYAPNYPELEKLFLAAKKQQMSPVQKQRLELIEENLIVLQWRLRNAGFLSADFKSPLQRDTTFIAELLAKQDPAFAHFPEAFLGWKHRGFEVPDIKTEMTNVPFKSSSDSQALPDVDMILIRATKDTEVNILPQKVDHGILFATYILLDQTNRKRIATGLFNQGHPIQFPAKANQNYYLYIPPRPGTSVTLELKDAKVTQGNFQGKVLSLQDKPATLLVYYPHSKTPTGVYQQDESVIITKGGSSAPEVLARSGKYDAITEALNLDRNWRFSPDPENSGLHQGVTNINFNDNSWQLLSALEVWQKQVIDEDGTNTIPFKDYHGTAWYRQKFKAIPQKAGKRLLLFLGGVDGNAECYLNGEKIGEHRLGDNFKGWNEYFYFDITQHIKPQNVIAVKVTSKSSDTASGIFKGVSILEVGSQ